MSRAAPEEATPKEAYKAAPNDAKLLQRRLRKLILRNYMEQSSLPLLEQLHLEQLLRGATCSSLASSVTVQPPLEKPSWPVLEQPPLELIRGSFR